MKEIEKRHDELKHELDNFGKHLAKLEQKHIGSMNVMANTITKDSIKKYEDKISQLEISINDLVVKAESTVNEMNNFITKKLENDLHYIIVRYVKKNFWKIILSLFRRNK